LKREIAIDRYESIEPTGGPRKQLTVANARPAESGDRLNFVSM
jgi:hypothetical protein